ncbi:hypothetical protein HG536_0H00600 [Torulaspora globosa]|uniref:Transcription initiation factor TFIID subunit 8 n=1 Tax=Torulaspora globosa TaxID=48254 RepID=A0A7G3ZME9_9SACH|nr:uncharacterized protein HG536_0H00600 [Torulaspora globosa]QLL34685.1 hypothetical protein HG536_0H00600 [Torulaspora globosa]
MVDPSHSKYVQLTRLPTLKEVHHEVNESTGEKILGKAVALQLKPMNAEISKFAFDYLLLLVEEQLNDMIGFLHKSSNIQRRELVAKADLQLFLEGFNLSPSDLELQQQISQHYSKIYRKELAALHSLQETVSEAIAEDEGTSQDVINSLVPPNNPLAKSVPKWMPILPPDHTYRFTPQYNHPITDETVIRRKIVEEGKLSEVALSHLLRVSSMPAPSPEVQMSDADQALAAEESMAIYGNKYKKRRKQTAYSSDLLSKLPQSNFNVEEYARSRVELARRKVLEYEEKQLQLQQNPFIKFSKMVLSTSPEKLNRRQLNKEINSMLKRSLYSLVKSIPKLQEAKQEARKSAEKARDERLQELRAQREAQERHSEQFETGDINLLDLDNHSDDFFNYSGSDNDEQERQVASGEANQQDIQRSQVSATGDAEVAPEPVPPTQEDYSHHAEIGRIDQTEHSGQAQIVGQGEAPESEVRPTDTEAAGKGEDHEAEQKQENPLHNDEDDEIDLDNTNFLFGENDDLENEDIQL